MFPGAAFPVGVAAAEPEGLAVLLPLSSEVAAERADEAAEAAEEAAAAAEDAAATAEDAALAAEDAALAPEVAAEVAAAEPDAVGAAVGTSEIVTPALAQRAWTAGAMPKPC